MKYTLEIFEMKYSVVFEKGASFPFPLLYENSIRYGPRGFFWVNS